MEPKESPILQGLNPAQRDAVVNYDSPSLIIAGAGSGKTRVLTSRIAYMIEQGVAPFNILALTFTNKAAQQMRERIAQMIPDNRSRYIRMGTFHSVFSRILRENAEKIGFPESFTIYEPSDCKNLIKTIVRELNLPDEKYKPNLIASRISYAKNCLVTPGAYLANSVYAAEDRQAQIPEFGNVYNIYCQRCKRNGAMDFDALLLQTNILLRDAPDVLAESIASLKAESEHMQELVEQLLFLARGDAGRTVLRRAHTNLAALVSEVCEESQMIDTEHTYRLASDAALASDPRCDAPVDVALVKQALRVIAQNAAKYSDAGTTVTFGITPDAGAGTIDISIEDEGIGMNQESAAHAFERFYRADNARDAGAQGSGLGLAIAKWIVDSHGGVIGVTSVEGVGSRFTIRLPR